MYETLPWRARLTSTPASLRSCGNVTVLEAPDVAGVPAHDLAAVLVARRGEDVAHGLSAVAERALRVRIVAGPEHLVRADVPKQLQSDGVFLEGGVAVLPPVVAREVGELRLHLGLE